MNTYLFRKMNRELRRMRFRAIGSGLLIFFAVAMYIGLAAMVPSASLTLDDLVEEGQLSDLIVRVESSDVDRLDALEQVPGVQSTEARLNIASRITFQDQQSAATLIGIDANQTPGINILNIKEGDYFAGDDSSVILEKGYADRSGISVGDTIEIIGLMEERSFTVIGLAYSPEFIFLPINPQSILPVPGSMGVVYLPLHSLQSLVGYEQGTVNEFLFLFSGDDDPTADIDAVLVSDTVLFNMPMDQIYGYMLIREDLSTGEGFTGVIAGLILIVAFFVIYSSFVRMVQEQRREIGVLRAIGYRRGQVLSSYIYVSLLIGGVASLSGAIFGAPIGLALSDMYSGMMFGTDSSGFVLSGTDMLIGVMFGPLTAMSASVVAVWATVRMEPHEAIKGSPSAMVHEVSVRHRSKVRNYLLLYAWRKLNRQKGRTAIMVLAVAFSVVMGAMSFLMIASLENSVTATVEAEGWDLIVDYAYPLDPDQVLAITPSEVQEAVHVGRSNVQWSSGQSTGNGVVIAMDQGQILHSFMLASGTWAIASGEAMVSSNFANENDVRIGESLALMTPIGDVTVEVTATVDDMIGDVFVDRSVLEHLLGEELLIGSYVKVVPGTIDQVGEAYLASSLVADVQKKDSISSGMLDLMGSYYDFILIFGLVSVTISAIAISNIIYVSVLERRTEYGQLRALGYQKRQVGRSIHLEVLIMVSIGALVAIPLLIMVLEGLVESFRVFFPVYRNILYLSDWEGYLLIVAMTFAMALLAAWPAIRTVGRMDVVKSVTGGRFG